jgi:hypothetical protein
MLVDTAVYAVEDGADTAEILQSSSIIQQSSQTVE